MLKKLTQIFEKHFMPISLPHVRMCEEDMSRYHVNYVWINRQAGPLEDVACSVPLRYLDIAYENARKYPKAQFTIWMDRALLDPRTAFFLASHAYFDAPDNLNFADLRDISVYAQSEVYDVEKPKDIWARVDLARLLVLSHQLNDADNKADFQLYTDFDVPDVKLDCQRMYRILNHHGLFVGMTLKYDILENGYLSFNKTAGKEFLEKDLLPRTMNAAKAGLDGYKPLVKTLHSWMLSQGFWYFRGRVSAPRQEMMGYVVPENPIYKDHKLN